MRVLKGARAADRSAQPTQPPTPSPPPSKQATYDYSSAKRSLNRLRISSLTDPQARPWGGAWMGGVGSGRRPRPKVLSASRSFIHTCFVLPHTQTHPLPALQDYYLSNSMSEGSYGMPSILQRPRRSQGSPNRPVTLQVRVGAAAGSSGAACAAPGSPAALHAFMGALPVWHWPLQRGPPSRVPSAAAISSHTILPAAAHRRGQPLACAGPGAPARLLRRQRHLQGQLRRLGDERMRSSAPVHSWMRVSAAPEAGPSFAMTGVEQRARPTTRCTIDAPLFRC